MVCDACQQAKSHQLPYPKSSSISHSPLDLIFSDVWALAPDSVGRNKYYVSFIDDHSKFVWLYTLRYKSEVFEKFHEFQKLVERRFNKKIVAVQTHWGGEYEKLNLFFRKVGITHLVSCPHAHQQNGAAERKHCHIVEVGLSLLAHSSMPLKYWDQAFLAVVYLIIRTPAKILRHSSPLETLFHEKPDYSMFRVFGCACWPNLGPYNARNLLSGLNDVSSWDIAPCTKDLSAWMFLLVASTSLVMLFLMSKFFPLLNFMLMLALVFILKLSFFLLLFLMLLLFLGVLRYLQQMCLIVHLTLLLTLVKIWRKIKLQHQYHMLFHRGRQARKSKAICLCLQPRRSRDLIPHQPRHPRLTPPRHPQTKPRAPRMRRRLPRARPICGRPTMLPRALMPRAQAPLPNLQL
jgi:hypothetical protein